MSCRTGFCRRMLWTLSLLALVVTLGGFQQAVAQENVDNDNVFELEGNPQDNPAYDGEDWETYFPGGGSGNAIVKSFVTDPAGTSIFTQGGSKDTNGVGQWKHTNGSVPDKDDLQHAFAAAYNVNGDLIIYFGADRTANNGDANLGFWFFKSNVAPLSNGTFSGKHQDGDIFVVSGFTSGGQTSEIDVYKWSCPGNPANCDTTGSLQLISSTVGGSGAECTFPGSGSHTTCAISNKGDVAAVWSYTPKSGTAGTYPVASFFEGGINVSALFPNQATCLSSFIAETRSSTSNTAQLKDLASGSFVLCGLETTKSCAGDGTVNAGGTSIHYVFNGTAKNTGAGSLDDVILVDTLPTGTTLASVAFKKGNPLAASATVACPAGAPSNARCTNLGTIAGNSTINWSVEFDSTSLSPQNNAYTTAVVAGTTVTSDPAQASCSTQPQNSVQIFKYCGVPADHLGTGSPAVAQPGTVLVTDSGKAVVQVNFSGNVCNTGQTPLTGVTLTDSPSATINVAWPGAVGALAANGQTGSCANYSGSYKPSGVTAGDLGGAAGRYSFADTIKVTGATASLGTSPGHDTSCMGTFNSDAQACGGATCNICPEGATCSGN